MSDTALARRKSVHVLRYERFRTGESFEDIAVAENITEQTAITSVQKGQREVEMRTAFEIAEARQTAVYENEKQRGRLRKQLATHFEAAMKALLEGKRVITSIDKATGAILTQEILDPEILASGVEQYRKSISLEEKPVAQTQINIQQNNTLNNGDGGGRGFDYETTLSNIRKSQKEAAPALEAEYQVVEEAPGEPEPAASTDEVPEPAASTPDDRKDTEWKF